MTEQTEPAADARRTLLAQRLRARITDRSYPLSYPQQRLWFIDQLEPGNPVYVVPLAYQVSGPLNIAALETALTGLVRRHQVLRTVFWLSGEVPRQSVRPAGPVSVPVLDVSGHDDPIAGAEQAWREEARRSLRLDEDLMIRPLLIRVGPEQHWLCLTMHHIACDGASLGVLGADLAELYRAADIGTEPDLPALPVQYGDYAERQAARLTGEPLREALDYWRERLTGLPALSALPTDRPRPPVQSYAGDHIDVDLGAELIPLAATVAREAGATPFAVLLAAFAVLVHAYTGGAEVVVGSPVSGRVDADVQRLIGFFTNTVVQRVDVSGQPTFAELVGRARDESRAAVANQDLPFEKLVEELHPSRDPAYNPIFQLMFSYHEGDSDGIDLPGCDVRMVPGDTATAKFDMTLSITQTAQRLSGRLEFATDLFDRETAESFARQYRAVLTAALTEPSTPISRIPVLSEEESRQLLVDWNPPLTPISDTLLPELIARQVATTPDAPAVLGADQSTEQALTYRELDARARALAGRLVARGVGPDRLVGVYLDRSPDLVVALLGILYAGGAYLPLDPGYPADRLAFMVTDSATEVVVSRRGLVAGLADLPVSTVEVDAEETAAELPAVTVRPENLAYVIYTSGSTGRPKGVQVTHRNVLTFFAGMDQVLLDDEPGTWLAVTSMSFDISVLELLWTLANGYQVVIRGDEPAMVQAGATQVPSAAQARPMDFSLFYFGGDRGGEPDDRYRLLIEGAKFADRNGFAAVWTPERHFHEFGGLYPNPAVTAGVLAGITENVAIRAGSVVLPLHDPLRVAEEWSVVDNVSHGRVGISVASGWQPNDFVLAPANYAERKKIMMESLAELRELWRGGSARRRNGVDADAEVTVFPPPVQPELPVWITSARSPETFQMAGEAGAGLLTHLLGHSAEQLAEKITLYRSAWRDAGHQGDGHVTLMLHAFAGPNVDEVRETVREPLCAYLKSSFDLLSGLGQALGREVDPRSLPEHELDELVAQAFDRFFETSGLLGSPAHCADMVDRLKMIGVDEVACLVDFGVPHQQVIDALGQLAEVRELSEARRRVALADEPISAQLRRHDVTTLQCTPSLAGVLAEEPEGAQALAGLRRLLVGGEALPAPLAHRLAELLPGRVHNMYGPTEATVWASTAPVRADQPVTIGTPMTNVRGYVVDAYQRPVPINVPGELLLGGEGIARGYLDRPALTAERFVPDPFSGGPGTRLYRTGDLVRLRRNGELEFLGRLDHQIKVHGHRIELGEIENALRAHPDVREAVAAVAGAGAHQRIIGYCVATPAGTDTASVRAFAGRTLPDYMVPADVVFLDALPHTPNGKIDRNRLPAPGERRTAEYLAPGTELERQVTEALADVLRVERVGLDDNFFESGGNSLLAVQARIRLRPVLGERLSLVDVFRYPTPRALVTAFSGDGPSSDERRGDARTAAKRRVDALARQARRKGRGSA